ncbi:hypothetical protein LTR09_011523 [Extremus antarcticus]|uniref:Uncharacterized protein n=1 Tax=Extremus antarcticus TaxID=702011 RepID=A0AAJ0GA76_9PEZI|nr:hypothetical protein LTR09_011523 [Extremus antarcticus]
MARGYYEVPRARPPPSFGPPRPRDKSLPPTNEADGRLQPRIASLRSRRLHVVVLLASPITTPAQDLLDDLNCRLGTSATIDVVYAPGLDIHGSPDLDLRLALAEHMANGGQLVTDAARLHALVRQSLGETGRATRTKQLLVDEVGITSQAS